MREQMSAAATPHDKAEAFLLLLTHVHHDGGGLLGCGHVADLLEQHLAAAAKQQTAGAVRARALMHD